MLADLEEQLGVGQLGAQVRRDERERAVELLVEPAPGGEVLGNVPARAGALDPFRPESGEVGQQRARLVLLDAQARQLEQAPLVVTRLDDVRAEPQLAARPPRC